jgi:hypothetical protein
VLIAFVLPGFSLAQSPPPASPLQQLQAARAQLDAGHRTEARAQLEPLAHGDDRRAAGEAAYLLATMSEHDLRFAEARHWFGESVTIDPGGRYAARGLARIQYLDAHSEGEFVPLTALERARNHPGSATDASAVEDLAHALPSFPQGLVRAESLLLIGQAYAGRLHRSADAVAVLRSLARDPSATTDTRALALSLLTNVRKERGELRPLLADLLELHGPDTEIALVRQLLRREVIWKIALVLTALVLAAGLAAVLRAVRSGRMGAVFRAWARPLPLAHLAMLSLGGALLARSESGHPTSPFLAFGAGALLVYLAAAAWNIVGSTAVWARIARAMTCALGLLAVSFLVMHRFDQDMLLGIGL